MPCPVHPESLCVVTWNRFGQSRAGDSRLEGHIGKSTKIADVGPSSLASLRGAQGGRGLSRTLWRTGCTPRKLDLSLGTQVGVSVRYSDLAVPRTCWQVGTVLGKRVRAGVSNGRLVRRDGKQTNMAVFRPCHVLPREDAGEANCYMDQVLVSLWRQGPLCG